MEGCLAYRAGRGRLRVKCRLPPRPLVPPPYISRVGFTADEFRPACQGFSYYVNGGSLVPEFLSLSLSLTHTHTHTHTYTHIYIYILFTKYFLLSLCIKGILNAEIRR